MAKLVWNDAGTRLFETGLDRGVLYTVGGVGVPWNGLTSVKEGSDGGDANPRYIDGVKYLNTANRETFSGSIEAFTYPDEFSVHDGTFVYSNGLYAMQQQRLPFAFSYRTLIGNDLVGQSFGYKLHIIYNALAAPADRDYDTMGDSVDPIKFSWDFSTTPQKPVSKNNIAPLSHVIIDSRTTDSALLRYIEETLYGSTIQEASLISLNDLFNLFDYDSLIVEIVPDPTGGLAGLTVQTDGTGDLIGGSEDGVYNALSETRLIPTSVDGIYRLNFVDDTDPGEDSSDPGFFSSLGLIEDLPNDPGFYLVAGTEVHEDTADEGFYIESSDNDDNSDPGIFSNLGLIEDLPNDPGTYLTTGTHVTEDLPNDPGTYNY